MNISQFIEYIQSDKQFMSNVSMWLKKEAKEGIYRDYPDSLNERIINVFKKKGIERLYSHQYDAFMAVQSRKDIVVVTPTASGKTMCYNLPVLNKHLADPNTRSLFIFPTKALAQDQMIELNKTIELLEADIKTYTFDGDTPGSARKAIREAGHIVVTNPDMLHSGILPHHTIWIKLFENLSYIVIDEVHSYRGVFGSHFANVIRRLKRICAFYGSNPQFILCSATIKNPQEHASALIGKDVALIDNNGSPTGDKYFVIYNPPVINEQLGIRGSSVKHAAKIGAMLLRNFIPTIIFARSRMRVEIISTYLKRKCPGVSIAGYRGGYLPSERRTIEKGLRAGEILGVVSTNALELGIDIGMLDAVISCGYPGSISSMHQQFGRAGRRKLESLSIMISTSSPLDQYIAKNPSFFISSNPENATINPDNLLILLDHIKCAAFEIPFTDSERFAAHLSTTKEMLDYLSENGVLKKADNRYHWMSDIYPATEISMRTASKENFIIVDKTKHATVIGEVDYFSAPTLIHTDAIYIHQGRQYYIDQLDWERRTAYCHEVEVEYYTDAHVKTDLAVLEDFTHVEVTDFDVHKGEVNIREQAVMFKKIRFNTHENLGTGPITLPEIEMHTAAVWIDFDAEYLDSIGGLHASGNILYGISYLLKNISPVFTFSDIMDINTHSMIKSDYSGKPTIFVYDSTPGGIGLSDRLYDNLPSICESAVIVLDKCECTKGCPSCIGPNISDIDNIKDFTKTVLLGMINGFKK